MVGSPTTWPDVRRRPAIDRSRWSGLRESSLDIDRLLSSLPLVQVDQIAEGVVEDSVDAAVIYPRGLFDGLHAHPLQPLGPALAVVGTHREHGSAGPRLWDV